MKSFEQFLNESTKSRKSTRRLHEATEPFEITDTKDMSVKAATAIIGKNYPKNLTYNGMEFFNKIYMKSIDKAAEKSLSDGSNQGQESYLGYLPDEDTFIAGWDTWENENGFRGNVAFVKVDDTGTSKVIKTEGCAGDMMYGKYGSLQALKKRYSSLVDIRLG